MSYSKCNVMIGIMALLFLSACEGKKEEPAVPDTQSEIVEPEPAATEEVQEETEEPQEETDEDDGSYYFNGEYVVFGKYEQDGDLSNGPEPIEWVILEDDDEKMFLISRYILDCHTYQPEQEDVTWETCELRAWLNSDFYDAAFSPAAQQRILTTSVSTSGNEFWETDGGNDTQDKMFCLSLDEVWKYYEMQRWFDEVQIGFGGDLITDMTQYAEDNGADHYTIEQEEFERMMIYEGYDKDVIGKSSGGWWLRTPGHEADWACIISYKGNMGWSSDSYVNFGRMGVRPAMNIEKMK